MKNKKNHFAVIENTNLVYQVFYKNELVLESDKALELTEHYNGQAMRPVIYFEPSVVDNLLLTKNDLSTTCPIKGDASYWSYSEADNGIWSYENPNDDMIQIKDHVAFDQTKKFRVKVK